MRRLFLWTFVLATLPGVGVAQTSVDAVTTGQAVLSIQGLLDAFTGEVSHWTTATQSAAIKLLGILALIDLALALIKKAFKNDDMAGALAVLVRWIMTTGFFLWVIKDSTSILGSIPKSFEMLGGQASGLGALNPGKMFTTGLDLAATLAGSVSVLTTVANPFVSFLLAFTCLGLVIAFAVLAFQMFACLIHVYILLGVAPILLAGGGLSFTRDWAISQFKGAVSTGVNILVIYLIAGVVTSFIPSFQAALAAASLTNIAPVLTMFGASLLIMLMAFKAPSIASAIMSGTNSMSGNDMVGFGMAALATAAGGATMALKGLAGAAGMAGNAAGGFGGLLGGGGGGQISQGAAGRGSKKLSDFMDGNAGVIANSGGLGGGASGAAGISPRETAQSLLGPIQGSPWTGSSDDGPTGDSGSAGRSSAMPATGGDALDAGIGGVGGEATAETKGTASKKTSPPASAPTLSQKLDRLNDSLQRGIERTKANMPEATHSGTVHIDSRTPGE